MDALYQQLKEFTIELKRNKLFREAAVLDHYLLQYCYRYLLVFGCFDEEGRRWVEDGETLPIKTDSIEELLFDGCHNILNDEKAFRYHEAGRPRKLAVKWHVGKTAFSTYFWFVDEAIKDVFDRFYGPHPDTKTDFMIQIDSKNNKYQLAMYRYGLKEPYVLPKESYELIVFRNKFEAYRSENYSQKTGAWIW